MQGKKLSATTIKEMKQDGVNPEDNMQVMRWYHKKKMEHDAFLEEIQGYLDQAERRSMTDEKLHFAVRKASAQLPDTPAEALMAVLRDVVLLRAETTLLKARVALLERRPDKCLHYLGITKESIAEEMKRKEADGGKKETE